MADRRRLQLYAEKWRWYNQNSLPWNRLALHREFARREAFVRWPIEGNVLAAFRRGWLEIGPGVVCEPHVWLSVMGGRLTIGEHTYLNMGVFVSVRERVEIGSYCMFANGSFITDCSHEYRDPTRPVPWQGMRPDGPTRIGDNVWCGVNCAILGGVTIGERAIIGAGSVVTRDIPAHSIAVGVPARVVRTIEYDQAEPELTATDR